MAPTYPGQHEDEERERKRRRSLERADTINKFILSVFIILVYAITRIKFTQLGDYKIEYGNRGNLKWQ